MKVLKMKSRCKCSSGNVIIACFNLSLFNGINSVPFDRFSISLNKKERNSVLVIKVSVYGRSVKGIYCSEAGTNKKRKRNPLRQRGFRVSLLFRMCFVPPRCRRFLLYVPEIDEIVSIH